MGESGSSRDEGLPGDVGSSMSGKPEGEATVDGRGGRRGPVAGEWAQLAAWGGSLVLHGALGVALVTTAPAAPVVENATSGSWAGSLFEVGLSVSPDSDGAGAGEDRESAIPDTEPPASPVDESPGEASEREPVEREPAEREPMNPSTVHPSVATASPVIPVNPIPVKPSRGEQVASGESPGGASDDAPGADASGGGAERAGLGGETAPTRVGQLPAAWTRALPAAARGDTTWHDLSPGLVGRWLVLAKLDDAGALTSLRVESDSRPFVDRLLRVSQALLRAGRFALPAGSSGEHRLGLEVWVDGAGEASDEGEPHLVRQLASRYPTAEEPGEALVVFNSGRRVQLRVYVEPRW